MSVTWREEVNPNHDVLTKARKHRDSDVVAKYKEGQQTVIKNVSERSSGA